MTTETLNTTPRDDTTDVKPKLALSKPRSTVAGIILSIMAPYPTVPGMVFTTAVQGLVPPSVKAGIKPNTQPNALLPVTLEITLRDPLTKALEINKSTPLDKQPSPEPGTPVKTFAIPGATRRQRTWQTAQENNPRPVIPLPPEGFAAKLVKPDQDANVRGMS